MIVTLSGTPGSGKSAVARRLATALHVPHYSMGDLRRQAARERGLTVEAMNQRAGADPSIERAMDAVQQQLAASGASFVIDGRLSHHFIPRGFKVFLTCETEESARRVQRSIAQGERTTEGAADSLETIRARLAVRLQNDRERLMTVYRIRDPFDPAQFDLVIDTTRLSVEAIVATIERAVSKRESGVGSRNA